MGTASFGRKMELTISRWYKDPEAQNSGERSWTMSDKKNRIVDVSHFLVFECSQPAKTAARKGNMPLWRPVKKIHPHNQLHRIESQLVYLEFQPKTGVGLQPLVVRRKLIMDDTRGVMSSVRVLRSIFLGGL